MMNKFYYIIAAIITIITFSGCSADTSSDNKRLFHSSMNQETTQQTEIIQEEKEPLFVVAEVNSVQETILVYSYDSGLEYQYYYGMSTEFLNKYGDHMSVGNIRQGDAVYITGTDRDGKVRTVQKSDVVWVNDNVKNFNVDSDHDILKIGNNNYKIDDNTMIFSGNEVIDFKELSDQDSISIVGYDKSIVSVSVTTGHGTLKLENTSLFEGSFLQLGDRIFAEITPDMTIEVPEGTYTLAVANNGWGSTSEIEIIRGEETIVDLDARKGDGPKTGRIQFEIDVNDSQIYIDGEAIDCNEPIELSYGKHSLKVEADGYDSWSRTLYVNSPEATIQITLESDDDDTQKSSESSSENSSQNDTQKDSEADTENDSENESEKETSWSNKELADYLSTLTSLMSLD